MSIEQKLKRKEYMKRWRVTNRSYIRQYQNRYRKERPESRKKEYTPEAYQRRREKILAYQRAYYQRNKKKARELANERKRRWRRENPIESRLQVQARRLKMAGVVIHKKEICNWQTGVCGICSKLIDGEYDIDHKIPLSRGGKHEVANLQLAHRSCNRRKHNKLPDELAIVYA